MADPITADDIKRYLDSQNDFDLELFVVRTLVERGIPAHHGGTYIDPITDKPRQYDVRASKVYPGSESAISLAIECKSLTADFPMVVSRVPRPEEDSYHELIRSWGRPELGEEFSESIRLDRGLVLYPPNGMVGKKTAQIRWDANRKAFSGRDSETYEKWSQALASAAGLVKESLLAHLPLGLQQLYSLVLPVLVVSDGTLWVIDYTEAGARAEPALVEEATLFADRDYELPRGASFRVSHLHIYTRTGFTRFVGDLASDRSAFWERAFGLALRRAQRARG